MEKEQRMFLSKSRLGLLVIVGAALIAAGGFATGSSGQASSTQQGRPTDGGAAKPVARTLGTIQSMSGKNIMLATQAGASISITVQDAARILRIEPGEKDLKNASPITLQDLQVGDRILV